MIVEKLKAKIESSFNGDNNSKLPELLLSIGNKNQKKK